MSDFGKIFDKVGEDLSSAAETVGKASAGAVSAGSKYFNRIRQKTEEMFDMAEATPLDSEVLLLLAQSEKKEPALRSLIKSIEIMYRADSASRVIENMSTLLDTGVSQEGNQYNFSNISNQLVHFSSFFISETNQQYSNVLASVFNILNDKWKQQHADIFEKVLAPLKSIVDIDYQMIMKSKSELYEVRLDMDFYKNQVKKGSQDPEVHLKCGELTSMFDMRSSKLKEQLSDFCGELIETKIATCLEVLRDILKNYHANCNKILNF